MKAIKHKLLFIWAGMLLISCSSKDHSKNTSEKIPTLSYTIWTPKTELFVEFPALVVGKQSKFAAHFTTIKKHQPINKGMVTVSLIQGNKGIRKTVDAPSFSGVFLPVLQPNKAEKGRLEFLIKTETYTDTITISQVEVYATIKEAQKALNGLKKEKNKITFLKEQAWKMEFQTAKVKEKMVFHTINTSGVWKTSAHNSRTIVANANGKVTFAQPNIVLGKLVKKGETIMNINSKGLSTNKLKNDLQRAKIDLNQAKSEYERKKELYKDQIISQSEFDLIKQKYLLKNSNYKSLLKGYSSSGYTLKNKAVKAPFSGYLQQINVANGSFVNEGNELFTINKSKTNVLEIQVSPLYAQELNSIQNIWYKTSENKWSNLKKGEGSVLSIDKIISDKKPMISVFIQVNEMVNMPQGSFTEATINTGNGKKAMVIPASALLESYGKYSVIVQLSGENFEQRNVTIGNHSGSEVEIIKGLQKNEMVVTKGAYQVKMQAMEGKATAHGHAH